MIKLGVWYKNARDGDLRRWFRASVTGPGGKVVWSKRGTASGSRWSYFRVRASRAGIYRTTYVVPSRNPETGAQTIWQSTYRTRARQCSGGGAGGGCHPNYSPCLPIVRDLDCDQIADWKKPIRVIGDDPYRLDEDGDGFGCELD